jgi:hypothetical protein
VVWNSGFQRNTQDKAVNDDEAMEAADETAQATDSELILPGEFVRLHIARVPLTLLEDVSVSIQDHPS